MTSKERLKRDLETVQRALDVETKNEQLELDMDRVPEPDKQKMLRSSEILRKYARLNGFSGTNIILTGITSSEETELMEGAQLFNKYAEPAYILRRERRGRWRPIH